MSGEPADREGLVAAAQAQYAQELRAFCRRMVYDAALAEEIVQETFLRLHRESVDGHLSLPGGGAEAAGTSAVRGWLYRVARNRCIDELRRMGREVRLSVIRTATRGGAMIDPLTTPAGKAIKAERAECVQRALDALGDDLRSVVILRVYQGLSREEIAEIVGLGVAGVKARLMRAFRQLRRELAGLADTQR